MALNAHQRQLLDDLRAVHSELRRQTRETYGRMNPFVEDLLDWKERGTFWTKGDDGVTIFNSTFVVGEVEIGEGTWIGPYCSLDGTGGLRIGKNCSVSLGCQLLTHDTVKWALSGGEQAYEYGSTSIGDFCFLGSLAVVAKGVSVGERSVIGAGAVVTKDVPPMSIVAGVPARVIGRVSSTADGHISLDYA